MEVEDGDEPLVLTEALERLGRYHLIERIGVGGMAEVYLAEQEGLAGFSRTVVVKRILEHLASDRHYVEMFLREAQLAARLQHTHIVQLLDFAEDGGNYFIAMEHVDGLTLDRLAATAWRMGRSLPMELVCAAVAEAALGLHHAHTRPDGALVHRDVTPENLMINREGVTKVLDFGIAKPLDDKSRSMTAAGELKGKLRFLSPEQVTGKRLDARTDVFSLGVTLYWLLTGVPPADGASDLEVMEAVVHGRPPAPRTINETIPAQLEALVLKMLAKDPDERVQDADAVHDALAFCVAARRKVVMPFVADMLAAGPATQKAPRDLKDLAAAVPATELMSSWGLVELSEAFPLPPRTEPPVDDAVTLDDQPLPALAVKSDESVFTTKRPLEPTVQTRVPRPPSDTVVEPASVFDSELETDPLFRKPKP